MTLPFHEQLLLLITTPVYVLVIGFEIIVSHLQVKNLYSFRETLNNIVLSALNSGLDLLCRGFYLVVLMLCFQHNVTDLSWSPVLYWFLLFLGQDLAFYIEHRVDHSSRFFWAVHVTHHSSTEFNLTTGFRSSVLQPLYRFIYFVPLAFLGFKPLDIVFMFSLTQIYGILVHTQFINKMPAWFETFFVSPSHHRVHHSSNIRYLDKNMGMVLIIWDKLFGTFQSEISSDPPKFGLVTPLNNPGDPVKIITHEWEKIVEDIKKPLPLLIRLKYLFMAPGWSHDGSRKTSKQLQSELS
jgi:sterol desaturase/sphingolipid hydroxylase (fatty acid hydroxylase superfamily)